LRESGRSVGGAQPIGKLIMTRGVQCAVRITSNPTVMSSPVPPSRKTLLHLYAATLRASRGFSSYNFRHYFLARTKDAFRGIQTESDSAKLSSFYQTAVEDLAVLKRSAIVNSVYGGWKLVVEKDKIERIRGVN